MSEINVTPLVDVMLVLLIIFMVTAPLLQAGVEIELPEAKAPVLDSEDPTLDMLTVETFGLVRFNDAEIRFSTLADLRAALGDRIANRPKLPGKPEDVFIRANRDLPYGYIVGIMALLQEMGVEKLGLVTDLPEEGTEPATPGGIVPAGPPAGTSPEAEGRIPPIPAASTGSSE